MSEPAPVRQSVPDRADLMKLARFVIVGGLATLVYVATGFILLEFEATVLVAHIVASVVSLVFSYVGQKIVTFGIRGEHRRMGPRFAIATAGLLVFQFCLVWLASRLGASDGLALILNTIIYPPTSFLVHSVWTKPN